MHARQLVGATGADRADQKLYVVFLLREFGRECIQQLRDGSADSIRRSRRSGQRFPSRRNGPRCGLPRPARNKGFCWPTIQSASTSRGRLGRSCRACRSSRNLACTTFPMPGIVSSATRASSPIGPFGRPIDAGEKRRELPELLAPPLGERMIVTLGTLDPHAEEDAGRPGGNVFWLGPFGDEIEPGPLPAGRCLEQFADDLIVSGVIGNSPPQPLIEGRGALELQLRIGVDLGHDGGAQHAGQVRRIGTDSRAADRRRGVACRAASLRGTIALPCRTESARRY